MRSLRGSVERLYVEVVKGRSSVRISQADDIGSAGQAPIFILGLFRSGTTVVRYVLDSHSRIACPPENEFLVHSAALLRDERSMKGLESAGFDRGHVASRSREFVSYFYENYARSLGKERWADKTPAHVEILDEIAEIFPDAWYVVIHRHPLDQVHSFTAGGTRLPPRVARYVSGDERVLESAARYWAINTGRLMAFAAAHDSRVVQIRYEDMVSDPGSEFHRVLSFLGEPWEPDTLNYWDFAHDVGFEAGSALSYRAFQASTGGFKKWDPSLVESVLGITAGVRSELAYGDHPF